MLLKECLLVVLMVSLLVEMKVVQMVCERVDLKVGKWVLLKVAQLV